MADRTGYLSALLGREDVFLQKEKSGEAGPKLSSSLGESRSLRTTPATPAGRKIGCLQAVGRPLPAFGQQGTNGDVLPGTAGRRLSTRPALRWWAQERSRASR